MATARFGILVAVLASVPALAAIATAAPLSAVEPEVTVDFSLPLEPLDPLLALAAEDGVDVPVTVTYRVPSAAYSPRPTRIELQVLEIPPWLLASLDPARFEIEVDDAGFPATLARTYRRTATLTLTAAPGAAALADGSIVLRAVARENGALSEASDLQHGLVRVTVASRIDAMPDAHSLAPDPGESIVVPVRVRNLGASAVVATASLVAAPRGVKVNLTALDTELAHAGAPARADETTFLLEISRERAADAGEVVIEVTARYAAGGTLADSRIVRVYVGDDPDAAARGLAGAGVLPGLAFLAAAAVVAGVLVKR